MTKIHLAGPIPQVGSISRQSDFIEVLCRSKNNTRKNLRIKTFTWIVRKIHGQ